jgi:SSS family solute:Na+ symporter
MLIAGIALLYVAWGGLMAVVWADLFQGIALLVGGLITFFLGLKACGGWSVFVETNADRLQMILPAGHEELPWTVLVGGMWIPIFYYCGLNQFITQRSLAARTLKQGQLGVIFAGALWLLVPVAIVMPGIMAQQLYGADLERPDQAYPTLIRELVPNGIRGLIFAALAGAVISSLASMLNSASAIFTMDLYRRYLRPEESERRLVLVGRMTTVIFLVIACGVSLSPWLKGGVFKFIQEFQGFISPGILAAFAVGFALPKAPPAAGVSALALSAPIYGFLQWQMGEVAYLHRMLLTFAILVAIMVLLTLIKPLAKPRKLPVRADMDMTTSPVVYVAGAAVIAGVVLFFIVFS